MLWFSYVLSSFSKFCCSFSSISDSFSWVNSFSIKSWFSFSSVFISSSSTEFVSSFTCSLISVDKVISLLIDELNCSVIFLYSSVNWILGLSSTSFFNSSCKSLSLLKTSSFEKSSFDVIWLLIGFVSFSTFSSSFFLEASSANALTFSWFSSTFSSSFDMFCFTNESLIAW